MRITIVTAYFYPEISPITHLYRDLAEDLASFGAEVTVVTGKANRGLDAAAREEYRGRTDETAEAGYRILRVGSDSAEGTGLVGRGLHFVGGTLSLYRAAKRTDADVYLLGSMPPFLGVVGARLAKRAKTVYILQDIFPDSVLLMGKLTENHPVTRVFRAMERIAYRGNTRFVTISEDMKRTLLLRGIDSERIDVIGNWTDTDAVRPVARETNPLFDELGLDRTKFIALYAGTLGDLQCPDLLLDAAKLLSAETDIGLVIFGGGKHRERIRGRIEAERIGNVRLFDLLPPERSSEVYSVGDVALVPLASGTTRIATPSKTWTALAAGRPVILTAETDSAWARLLSGADVGTVIEPGSAEAMADAIRFAARNRAETARRGEQARAFACSQLVRRTATERYFETLKKAALTK